MRIRRPVSQIQQCPGLPAIKAIILLNGVKRLEKGISGLKLVRSTISAELSIIMIIAIVPVYPIAKEVEFRLRARSTRLSLGLRSVLSRVNKSSVALTILLITSAGLLASLLLLLLPLSLGLCLHLLSLCAVVLAHGLEHRLLVLRLNNGDGIG